MASSWTRDISDVPCISRQILNHWTTREVWVIYFKSNNYLVVILIFSGGNFNHPHPPTLYVSLNITCLSGFSVPQVVIAKCLPSHVSSLNMSCRCSSQMYHSPWPHPLSPHTHSSCGLMSAVRISFSHWGQQSQALSVWVPLSNC